MTAKVISDLRKAGRVEEALRLAREEFRECREDSLLQNAYGWTIHERLKVLAGELGEKRLTPADVLDCLPDLLREYAHLKSIRRPDLLHSMILQKALKIGRDWPGLVRFLRWWDFAHFREEDRTPYVGQSGRATPSLEMQAAYAVARSLADGRLDDDDEARTWAIERVEYWRAQYPKDRWLPYYWCKWCLHTGQQEAARTFATQVVVNNLSSTWAWHLLAQTCAEVTDAILCNYRAIVSAREPKEVARVRIELAELLVHEKRFDEAAYQVGQALGERGQLGYRIPPELEHLAASDWYRKASPESGPTTVEIEECAAEVLWKYPPPGAGTTRIGVLDHHNQEKALSHVAFSATQGQVLHHQRFKSVRGWPLGTVVELLIAEDAPHVLRAQRTDLPLPKDVGQALEGTYSVRDGQPYGFVRAAWGETIFVPPEIRRVVTLADGARVRCIAVRSLNKKRGMEGWKAVTVDSAD